ncbi:MAG TPA: hypothetical protein VFK97_03240 [Candidatus Saccharimonadales bacterium]|nr:hypothetical protein [Candidatus Saccharimonadales bacterium]
MAHSRSDRKTIDKVFILLGVAVTLVLLAVGCLAWYAGDFAKNTVRTELADQKIYFPPKGSPAIAALPAADQAQMNQYAGQQLLDGAQAKVYANNFIAVHLDEVAGGQTYAEVSTKALADPSNAKLQAQKTTLFQGETLRGLLLGDGYAYWTFGQIAQYTAIASLAGVVIMSVLVLLGLGHLSRLNRR